MGKSGKNMEMLFISMRAVRSSVWGDMRYVGLMAADGPRGR